MTTTRTSHPDVPLPASAVADDEGWFNPSIAHQYHPSSGS